MLWPSLLETLVKSGEAPDSSNKPYIGFGRLRDSVGRASTFLTRRLGSCTKQARIQIPAEAAQPSCTWNDATD
jgi:hypothetical protein